VIFSPARRGTNATDKDTLLNVKEVAEVCINIVNYDIVEQMSLTSTAYDRGINEFKKAGLTEVQSDLIGPPRVAESPVAMECKVTQVITLGQEGGAGNLIMAEVKKIHIQDAVLNDDGRIDTLKMNHVGRMGEMWYIKSIPDALFEVDKPTSPAGRGVDQLPIEVRDSKILTGNDLGRLGGLATSPSNDAIAEAQSIVQVHKLSDKKDLHKYAQELLAKDQLELALALLSL